MILLSHPTGNENVRHAAQAFCEADLLTEFWTSISWKRGGFLDQVLPARVRDVLRRRSFPECLQSRTRTAPAREAARLFSGAMPAALSRHETGPFSIDRVYSSLDARVAARLRRARGVRAVYAYEDGALASFRVAAEQGIARIYDLPIGYWRVAQEIFAEEREREPAWACTLTGAKDSEVKLARKEAELRLAERVVVASTFTKTTLASAALSVPIGVIPYGAPAPVSAEQRASAGKLRVLFVGSLSQRKGLSYLLAAAELVRPAIELTLLGRRVTPDCAPLEAALRQHRWIPSLSHERVLEQMQQNDVLVLPSLFEGFGLVISEAMAQAIPVIATPHTAGPDLIEDGVDGFIVPIRSAEAIATCLESLAGDRERLSAMKEAARRKAERQRWEIYRKRLVQVAREVVSNQDAIPDESTR
jgi:glycosyltransferase involved in cell wall biosynthesis